MSKSNRLILGLIFGVVFGAATAMALAIAATYMLDSSQVDTAFVKGAAFYFAPMGAMVGAIIWAIWAKRR
ncbi:hypothetical protein ABMA32_11105 [Mesorhizobium sp. VNQ89]|uniref:hypothetical protein n=1 Tax=Mesorhizobium quangtriensis TaxID=3157709 RepID=UPI0032B789E8